MGDTVIRVEGLAKKFCRRLRHSMYYGTLDVARGMLGMESRTEALRPGEFWAVDDVSFELKRGETLGLIGANGSGKSTLLRLINGIFPPDRGRIEIKGRVGALIAVGAGFHPLMTGRENIYLNGAIMGMGKREIDRKFDSIVDFADIGEFLDAPVKTYSSGMYVRLGFAVAIHCEPDILLVDEVLAVGDARFQQKCFGRIRALRDSGTTIILVAHNMDAILKYTERALLLERGALMSFGTPRDVVESYHSMLYKPGKGAPSTAGIGHAYSRGAGGSAGTAPEVQTADGDSEDRCTSHPCYNPGETRVGNGHARIVNLEMLDGQGKEVFSIASGGCMRFRFEVLFSCAVGFPVYGFIVKTPDGVTVFGTSTWHECINTETRGKGDRITVEFMQYVNLVAGDYFITAGVSELTDNDIEPVDRRYDLVHLNVSQTSSALGIAHLHPSIGMKAGSLAER